LDEGAELDRTLEGIDELTRVRIKASAAAVEREKRFARL